MTVLEIDNCFLCGYMSCCKPVSEALIHCIYMAKKSLNLLVQNYHLCFNITGKGHMIVPDGYSRILNYTRKYCKNSVFK